MTRKRTDAKTHATAAADRATGQGLCATCRTYVPTSRLTGHGPRRRCNSCNRRREEALAAIAARAGQ